MMWHNSIDHLYNRKAKTIGEAIEQEIMDAAGSRSGGVIEDLQNQHICLVAIVKVLADLVLTDEQERVLARTLRLKEASSEIKS